MISKEKLSGLIIMAKKLNNPKMKAVLYHADGHFGKRHGPDIYKHLTEELRKNLHTFGIPLIHVTVPGHAGWGDENYFYKVDNVNEVIYNREKCLLEFMRHDAIDGEIYWFCEPDFRMLKDFPPLKADICMLYRNDPMPMTPAWRLAKRSSLPFFEEAFKHFNLDLKEWHGDSPSWQEMHKQIGSPTNIGIFKWKDIQVELRPYGHYASRHKCIYSGQWKGGSKINICTPEYRKWAEEEAKKGT